MAIIYKLILIVQIVYPYQKNKSFGELNPYFIFLVILSFALYYSFSSSISKWRLISSSVGNSFNKFSGNSLNILYSLTPRGLFIYFNV